VGKEVSGEKRRKTRWGFQPKGGEDVPFLGGDVALFRKEKCG